MKKTMNLIARYFLLFLLMIIAVYAVIYALCRAVCALKRTPFDILFTIVPFIVVLSAVFFFMVSIGPGPVLRLICIPDGKTYESPDGAYTLEVVFYRGYYTLFYELYRFKAVLRDAESGAVPGRKEGYIRHVFAPCFRVPACWENCVRVEWPGEDVDDDIVWVVFPDRNSAYLLPSGESISPLMGPRVDRVLRRKE